LLPHKVQVNTEGRYSGAISFRADVVILDSGWRRTAVGGYGESLKIAHIDDHPVPLPVWASKMDVHVYDETAMYNYVDAETGSVFLSPYPVIDRCTRICGSKVILVTEEGEFLAIREKKEEKPSLLIDWVGGKIEVGETARSAMLREFYEETDQEMPLAHFLGISSALSSSPGRLVEYHSFMWVAVVPSSFTFKGMVRCRHVPKEGVVDWLSRLVDYVMQMTGTADALSLAQWIRRREGIQRSLLREHGTGQLPLSFEYCGKHTLMVEEESTLGELVQIVQDVLKIPPVRLELPAGSVSTDVGHVDPGTGVLINFATQVRDVFHGDRMVVFSIWDAFTDSFVPSESFVGDPAPLHVVDKKYPLEIESRRGGRGPRWKSNVRSPASSSSSSVLYGDDITEEAREAQ